MSSIAIIIIGDRHHCYHYNQHHYHHRVYCVHYLILLISFVLFITFFKIKCFSLFDSSYVTWCLIKENNWTFDNFNKQETDTALIKWPKQLYRVFPILHHSYFKLIIYQHSFTWQHCLTFLTSLSNICTSITSWQTII